MKKGFFITGTDTEIGKTYSTVSLLHYFNQKNLRTAALKPIASDAQQTTEGLRNDDALQLQSAMSMDFPYQQINPYTFEPAIAPHIASHPHTLTVETTLNNCRALLESDYDLLFVEGAGGWMAPLNDTETFADLAEAFGFPIILVVGLKLGCLNHSFLSYENIKSRGLSFAGWIANHVDPNMLKQTENIETLTNRLGAPPLGIIPYNGRLTTCGSLW